MVKFVPFDPVHKRTEATIKGPDGNTIKATKGAVQVIMDLVTDDSKIRPQIEKVVTQFAQKGYRSLAVAVTDQQDRWQFAGVLPLYDPPREDSKETIQTAEGMGIHVKMVTGDQLAIAKEVARELDLGSHIIDTEMFTNAKNYGQGQIEDAIEQSDGFAQVFPEHKYQIVEVLQKRKHIVGMTGDGVNDAPALKKADAGIAVAGATDAARAAADIVLLTPGLSVIIDAVKESRKIFQRMNSYAIYRIAETLRVLLFMTLSILVFNFYPVTAVMIVLLAILNDGAILSIAYDKVYYSQKPEKWNMPIVLGVATVLGIAGVIASFGLFYLGERVFHLNRDTIQTLMYLKLSVAGHLTIFITRTRGRFWTIKPARILLFAVIGTQAIATLFAVYGVFMTPIGWGWALLVWGYALVWFLVNDPIKLLAYRIFEGIGKSHIAPHVEIAQVSSQEKVKLNGRKYLEPYAFQSGDLSYKKAKYLAKAQKMALFAEMDFIIQRHCYEGQKVQGNFLIAYSLEFARNLTYSSEGDLQFQKLNGENAYICIAVHDAADLHFIKKLAVRVTVLDQKGFVTGSFNHPLIERPDFYHYGRNWNLPGDGKYTLRVRIEVPDGVESDENSVQVSSLPVEVEFKNVDIKTGQKLS